ncbi:MAG: AmmeMemoRadiSam system protein B [Campylobacterota bacterium]|nr:AmmeMemoRadiSam system protein B [Campylobacterota bacterium]
MSIRKEAVSGQFYPDTKEEIVRYIEHFNNILKQNNIKIDNTIKPKALIVPHAGYVYSGFTANLAYRYIPKNVKNIIVIGPSHKFGFEGASVSMYDGYSTPLGSFDINKTICSSLMEKFEFLIFDHKVHCEHSTETQFPFIKYYKPDVKVVEIVYSSIDYKNISRVIQEILKDEDNFVVISTDLSHFFDQNRANQLDSVCLSSIDALDLDIEKKGCQACGMIGVKAIIDTAKSKSMESMLLDYRTSADTTGDEKSVVGYVSAIIY